MEKGKENGELLVTVRRINHIEPKNQKESTKAVNNHTKKIEKTKGRQQGGQMSTL